MARSLLSFLFAFLVACAAEGAEHLTRVEDPVERASPGRSIHQQELEWHPGQLPIRRHLPAAEDLERAASNRALQRVVYGYYPYWVQDLESIRWSALTHLAWFAVEMDPGGEITARHGWPDFDTVAVAQAAGVRVDLTFTLFDGQGILALVNDPDATDRAITNMIDLMEEGGADGISVDFEGLVQNTRDSFSDFICQLRSRLDERGHAGAQISIAGPAVDWTDAFDLDVLLSCADWYFIMGYGYFWSGSTRAGPTGILRTPARWRPFQSRSMLRTLAHYSSIVPAEKRRQIVYGVPYYGREWITESDAIGAGVIDHVGSVTYSAARQALEAGQVRRFEADVANPWFAWQEAGDWHQVWFDDAESLAAKYALALDQDLGGVGMWALNYDTPHPDLWDQLEAAFSQIPEPPAGHRLAPIPVASFPFHDERDTAQGPGSYFNYYSCRPDLAEYGREWVYQIDVCQSGTLRAHVPEYPDRDPDLHLLLAPDQDACLARAHTDLEQILSPGRYLLVVDTFVDDAVEQAGSFELDVEFEPDPGSVGCAEHLVCQAGVCECQQAALSDCGDACVDITIDPAHCGACLTACSASPRCELGQCLDLDPPDGGPLDGGDKDLESSGGCQCGLDGRPLGGLFPLLALLWVTRRRPVRRLG